MTSPLRRGRRRAESPRRLLREGQGGGLAALERRRIGNFANLLLPLALPCPRRPAVLRLGVHRHPHLLALRDVLGVLEGGQLGPLGFSLTGGVRGRTMGCVADEFLH